MAKKVSSKAPAAPKPKKITPAGKPRSKVELFSVIAEQTMLTKKQVAGVFETLHGICSADLGKNGPKIVNIPGMMKVYVRTMPARKAREGVNPRTGEKMMYKAKPARNVVKIRALKMLKELA